MILYCSLANYIHSIVFCWTMLLHSLFKGQEAKVEVVPQGIFLECHS